MLVYILQRLLTLLATLAVASALIFAVLELLPGNAADVILGETATAESRAALEARLGLDRPALQRYADWVGGLLKGQTALSISYDTPTAELLAERLQVTVPLALMAMTITVVLALALVLGTQAYLNKTVTGRAMQAVAQNTESATVLGINVPRMIFYTFAINAVLACAAALLVTPTYLAKFDMGEGLGTKAFFAAIIGGFNNSRGALLGGVIVGVSENLAAAYISPAYKDAVALVIFMIVILFKPQGLLGKKVERKV